ncbi:MAG: hypothetical protein IJK36_05145 [Bacteroidales bacterium]|nr:hypothetical protein [Bacteroidales bacterium]
MFRCFGLVAVLRLVEKLLLCDVFGADELFLLEEYNEELLGDEFLEDENELDLLLLDDLLLLLLLDDLLLLDEDLVLLVLLLLLLDDEKEPERLLLNLSFWAYAADVEIAMHTRIVNKNLIFFILILVFDC